MRKRKEIERELSQPIATSQRMDNLKVELLLDIRDLLLKLFDAEELMKKEISQIKKQDIGPRPLRKR